MRLRADSPVPPQRGRSPKWAIIACRPSGEGRAPSGGREVWIEYLGRRAFPAIGASSLVFLHGPSSLCHSLSVPEATSVWRPTQPELLWTNGDLIGEPGDGYVSHVLGVHTNHPQLNL